MIEDFVEFSGWVLEPKGSPDLELICTKCMLLGARLYRYHSTKEVLGMWVVIPNINRPNRVQGYPTRHRHMARDTPELALAAYIGTVIESIPR